MITIKPVITKLARIPHLLIPLNDDFIPESYHTQAYVFCKLLGGVFNPENS